MFNKCLLSIIVLASFCGYSSDTVWPDAFSPELAFAPDIETKYSGGICLPLKFPCAKVKFLSHGDRDESVWSFKRGLSMRLKLFNPYSDMMFICNGKEVPDDISLGEMEEYYGLDKYCDRYIHVFTRELFYPSDSPYRYCDCAGIVPPVEEKYMYSPHVWSIQDPVKVKLKHF